MDNQLLRPKGRQKTVSSGHLLPDDVVIDILSRLPAKTVLKYQRVCRRWKALTSTQYFIRNHTKNSSVPMILVEHNIEGKGDAFLLLDATKKRASIDRVRVGSQYYKGFSWECSWDGLLVLRNIEAKSTVFLVVNPTTGEKVKISIPGFRFQLCGIFFHPLVEEYCILWRFFSEKPERFRILILGPEPRWRDLSTDASVSPNYRRSTEKASVVIDDVLYWLAYEYKDVIEPCPRCEIIAFDIRKEEISKTPDPDPKDECLNSSRFSSIHRDLLKMNGHLSLVQTSKMAQSFDTHIWTLKDSANGLWIKSCTLNTEVCVRSGIFYWVDLRPIAVVNEKLILHEYTDREHKNVHRIFAYNLEMDTGRYLGKDYINGSLHTLVYVPSLVSMRDWKSEILMSNR